MKLVGKFIKNASTYSAQTKYQLTIIVERWLCVEQTFSVIIAVIRLAGVTSNAGFQTAIPEADTCFPSPPSEHNNSFGDLSSITICCPDESERSIEVIGAAT